MRRGLIKNSPGGACPQTPLDERAYAHTVLILSICPPPPQYLGAKHLPLLEQNPEINPVLVHEYQASPTIIDFTGMHNLHH